MALEGEWAEEVERRAVAIEKVRKMEQERVSAGQAAGGYPRQDCGSKRQQEGTDAAGKEAHEVIEAWLQDEEEKHAEDVQEIFGELDADGDGWLNKAEMRVFLSQLGGFSGSAAEWNVEYERLGTKFNFDPKTGVSLEVFKEMMSYEDELVEAPEEAPSEAMTSDSEGESEATATLGRLASANTEKNRATKGPLGPAEGWSGEWGRGEGGSGPSSKGHKAGGKGRGRGKKGPKGGKESEAAGGNGKGKQDGETRGGRNRRRGARSGAAW